MQTINLNPRAFLAFSGSGFIISLFVHFLTLTSLYIVSNITIMALTTGMFLAWLQGSKMLKEIYKKHENNHPLKQIMISCPSWLKYTFYFIIIYSVINFAVSVKLPADQSFFNFRVSDNKLRGISGFWLAFYAFGFLVNFTAGRLGIGSQSRTEENEE